MISMVLLDTGMRAGEVCLLMDSDIAWTTSTIRVQGKTGERRCVMSDTLRPLLREWIDRKNDHLFALSQRLSKRYGTKVDLRSPYVFPAFRRKDQYNRPMDEHLLPHTISRMIRNHAVKAGLSPTMRLGSHAMRHTDATHLAMAGLNSFQIQQFLGHREIQASQGYVKLALKNVQQAVSSVGLVSQLQQSAVRHEQQALSTIAARILNKSQARG
jgi:integrase